MGKRLSWISLLLCFVLFSNGCSKDPEPVPPQPEGEPGAQLEGADYVFDIEALPEVHLEFPLEEWNALLKNFDHDPNNSTHVRCDVRFLKGDDSYAITEAGIRLRDAGGKCCP